MVQKFATKYTPKKTVGFTCSDVSRAEQCFKEECDINNIVRKPNLGVDPFAPHYEKAVYGDFSDMPTFHEAMNLFVESKNKFMTLPSSIRRRFNDNIEEFLDFVSDEKNIDEGIKLGIYEKRADDTSIETSSNPDVSAVSGASTSAPEASA